MLSDKLKRMIIHISTAEPSAIRRAALTNFQQRLEADAWSKCCLRCSEAEWLITWSRIDQPGQVDASDEWHQVLMKCGKGCWFSGTELGLLLPGVPFPYCTATVEGGGQHEQD